MIWFGKLSLLPPAAAPSGTPLRERMQLALESVARRAPHLSGRALLRALGETGWVDETTAARLLPEFRAFDPDRYFAEYLRGISFRGPAYAEEFRHGVELVVRDLVGSAEPGALGPEPAVRFRHGEHEGVVLAYPEVTFRLAARTLEAVQAAIEEMPDTLLLVARNFDSTTAAQLGGLLARTGVPATLVTLNLLLGLRATALRYQPPTNRVLRTLSAGRALHTTDVARLGDRVA